MQIIKGTNSEFHDYTGSQISETAQRKYSSLDGFDLTKPHCRYFAELSAIPRPSCGEMAAAAYIRDFALHRGLTVYGDEWGNTIIRKAGSAGREKEPWLMLQAHLDMVPAIDPEVFSDGHTHNWAKDPLDLYTADGWLKARGTTLGADDGVGAAYMLSILADNQLSHPPLECVFTVMEEIGLVGAMKLTPDDILSRRVISLDGGDIDATMCCAAGGIKGVITLPVDYIDASFSLSEQAYRESEDIQMEDPSSMQLWTLELSGFLGGHSGIEISKERGNAILLTVRLLNMMEEEGLNIHLTELDGGSGDNVIPAACKTVFISTARDVDILRIFETWKSDLMNEYRHSDAAFTAALTSDPNQAKTKKSQQSCPYLSPASQKRLLSMLTLLPNGISAMSIPMPGIPVTSNNIGTVQLYETEAVIQFRARSLLESGLDDIMRRISILCELTDAVVQVLIRYPGWNYQETSPMRDTLEKLLHEKYDTPLIIEGTHGGNETGIWYGLHPDSDIVSIGSIEENIHTPEERLNLEAFDRMYQILTEYIEML